MKFIEFIMGLFKRFMDLFRQSPAALSSTMQLTDRRVPSQGGPSSPIHHIGGIKNITELLQSLTAMPPKERLTLALEQMNIITQEADQKTREENLTTVLATLTEDKEGNCDRLNFMKQFPVENEGQLFRAMKFGFEDPKNRVRLVEAHINKITTPRGFAKILILLDSKDRVRLAEAQKVKFGTTGHNLYRLLTQTELNGSNLYQLLGYIVAKPDERKDAAIALINMIATEKQLNDVLDTLPEKDANELKTRWEKARAPQQVSSFNQETFSHGPAAAGHPSAPSASSILTNTR